jgi:hypothetical protein
MVTLTDSIEIKATPEQVFTWLINIRTGKDYQAWHPDHVEWQWIKGEPFQRGSVAFLEEYMHGNMHKLTFVCTKVVPNRLIEYKPSFPMSILMSKGQFAIDPRGEKSCIFTAAISFREGPFFRRLFRKQTEDLEQHMKEEGENLRKILEG